MKFFNGVFLSCILRSLEHNNCLMLARTGWSWVRLGRSLWTDRLASFALNRCSYCLLQFVFLPAFLWLRTAFHVFLFISCCFCYYYIKKNFFLLFFSVVLCCVVFLFLSLHLWYVIKSNSDDYTWAKSTRSQKWRRTE